MADQKCTESGGKLWSLITPFILGILIVEELFLKTVLEENPSAEKMTQLIGSSVALSTMAGLILLHKGLTGKTFDMSMRVALTVLGGLISSGALLGGIVLAATNFYLKN